jgi:hypothetical protein
MTGLVNYSIYEQGIPSYSQLSRLDIHSSFFSALIGNLISPNRGLFIFSPIVALSIIGILFKTKHRFEKYVLYGSIATIVVHWLVISSFSHWWAGHSYGQRFWIDVLPFFYILFIYLIKYVIGENRKWKYALMIIIAITGGWSIFTSYQGAKNTDTWKWNVTPTNVDSSPSRVWDWSDWQITRNADDS